MALDPKSSPSTSDTTNYRDSGYAPSSGSTPGRREPAPFHYFPSLQGVLRHPRILGRLLCIISYGDFNALTSSCSELRNLMEKPALKDVILSCFLPGFRSLLLSKTPELFVDVRVTISDLNVFYLSNRVGLHTYPLHALQFSTRFDEALELELLRTLQSFAIVHSKFILLLQSLAHSSHQPVEPELEDNSLPRLILQTSPPGIKQLYFPEPLCYCASPAIHKTPSFHRYRRSQSAEIATGDSRPSGRRGSILSRSRKPPPAPSSDFLIRQSYFSPWRRTLQAPAPIPTTEPRRRRFLSASNLSDSSVSSSGRLSIIQENRGGKSAPRFRTPLQSPHDIRLATSRSHAPILRVFVPCSQLDDTSIAACENQLVDADLWDHLSVGDIVCNLGYIPPSLPPELDGPIEGASASVGSWPSSLGSGGVTDDAVWLVYDGFGLVQYSPAMEPPPLKDALTLVTPYYYSHILPSSAHPFFTLDLHSRLSRFRGSINNAGRSGLPPPVPPKFELIAMHAKVRSPQSPGGYAMVKRYKWVATVKGVRAAVSGDVEVGSGWLTNEWALEVDGTLEGRRLLDSLLTVAVHVATDWARGDLVWEVDRQRSNFHKTWFRLLGDSEDYVLPLDYIALNPNNSIPAVPMYGGSLGYAAGKRRKFSFMER